MLMSVLTLNPYDFSAQQISTLKTAPPYGGKTPSPSIMQLFEPKSFHIFREAPDRLKKCLHVHLPFDNAQDRCQEVFEAFLRSFPRYSDEAKLHHLQYPKQR